MQDLTLSIGENDTCTMLTVSGRQVNLLYPKPEMIDLGDIAHALSRIQRFAGHTTVPYTVAQALNVPLQGQRAVLDELVVAVETLVPVTEIGAVEAVVVNAPVTVVPAVPAMVIPPLPETAAKLIVVPEAETTSPAPEAATVPAESTSRPRGSKIRLAVPPKVTPDGAHT